MNFKRTTAAILGGALLCGMTAFAAGIPAQEAKTEQPTADPTSAQQNMPAQEEPLILPERELYYGRIAELLTDEAGQLTGLRMESEAKGEWVFHIDGGTLGLDSGMGTPVNLSDLKAGDGVYVFHSPAATMSLPPQSYAEAVVVNVPMDAGAAMLHTVEAVQQNADGSLMVTTDRGGLHLTISQDAKYMDYKGRQIMGADDLRIGTRIFAWYPMVMESYPAQTSTGQLVVVPAADRTEIRIVVNGKTLEETAKIENGTLMAPAGALARAFGMTAEYERGEDGEYVTLKNDQTSMVMTIGSDTYVVEGDMVMGFGAPAAIEAPGVTWMPASAMAALADTTMSLATGDLVFADAVQQ